MANIKFKNVFKKYGDQEVVKGINLDIKDGEFVVLVGPSGCGKSTSLRMLAGLETITSGDLLIEDQIVNNIEPKDRGIAMVFQNYALYPHMTVEGNMAFALKLRGMGKEEIHSKVLDTAKMLGLESLLNRKPGQLSGGQRQRVAMGRALVRNPKVFLFDEPLSNLDAKLRNSMRTEIKKLHQQLKTTIVYVTHDQVEAMTLADRIVVMRQGVIEQLGTPSEVFHHPASRFVAEFIGAPPMNIIEGNIDQNHITSDSFKFKFEVGNFKPLQNSQKVLLGLRPENLYLSKPDSLNDLASIEVEIDLVEPLGAETLLHFLIGNQKMIARVAGTPSIKVNQKLSFYYSAQKIELFSIDDEKTLRS